MPASRWPGIRHEYSNVPARVNFQTISADFFGASRTPFGSACSICGFVLHRLAVLQIFFRGGEQEFVIVGADVADHEADLLAALHLDARGRVGHLAHPDLDGAGRLFGVAGLARRIAFVGVLLMAVRPKRQC